MSSKKKLKNKGSEATCTSRGMPQEITNGECLLMVSGPQSEIGTRFVGEGDGSRAGDMRAGHGLGQELGQ